MCDKPRGLVLVTGPTGSGKSTTLAAMIDKINTERHEHILTIEDPIEFVHMNKNCVVNQREVHSDTKSFTDALRAALREDPDVVLIGENARPRNHRVRAAYRGNRHLTFGTLHTNSASSTINRVIDAFSRRNQQSQIRAQLSLVLEAQHVPKPVAKSRRKGRAMCMEILVPMRRCATWIREDKIHQIYSSMQSGQEKYGMQTFNQSLANAYFQKQITLEMAMTRSSNQDTSGNDFARRHLCEPWRCDDSAGQGRCAGKAMRSGVRSQVSGFRSKFQMSVVRCLGVRSCGP